MLTREQLAEWIRTSERPGGWPIFRNPDDAMVERMVDILCRRYCEENPPSRRALAEEYGIPHGRVRGIESHAVGKLRARAIVRQWAFRTDMPPALWRALCINGWDPREHLPAPR
jgi:DNA-directed RNA polymerase sigma subunit (sigma70/sigma32)